ncbi:MAG: ABC transporter ATP-binding protein [Candidatus Methylarchaceae archaeon HK02M2]|nr:ABC transporter ATP-binding protein [Candidatus Methylarchaceae archaeon HK02M2]
MKANNKVKVSIKNVSKSFDNLKVIDEVSFDVFEGQFICIIGPSGCGKTTFLKIVAGIEKPSSGSILVDGFLCNPKICNIGFVFQEESLLPWRNVYENIRFGLEMSKRDHYNDFFNSIVEEMIKLVGLNGFEKYYPNKISGGMKKRVAIARALAVDPSILLMDEPFGDLDAQTRWIMHKELKLIHKKLKKTIIFVTHNVEEAVYLGDLVIVFSKRPIKLRKILPIELPEPRDKLSEQFIKYREMIISLLREEIIWI